MARWSEDDLNSYLAKKGKGSSPPKAKKKHKYSAKAIVIDGIRFDSQKEGRYFETLKLAVRSGELLYFLRQVPLHLDGGTKLVIDFLEFWKDGSVVYTDVKGFRTAVYKVKKREIEAKYPIKINEV